MHARVCNHNGHILCVFCLAGELGIGISGVHPLRANYAQMVHKDLMNEGKSGQEVRHEVSRRLGHNRVDVTNSYIPPEMHNCHVIQLYNLLMPLGALGLPSIILKQYRPGVAIRRGKTEMSAALTKGRRRVGLAARKAAELLRAEIGEKKIFIFGSLARHEGFIPWSAIELATRGYSSFTFL